MRLKLFLAALLVSGLTAAAPPIDGLYGEVFGGYAYVPGHVDSTINGLLRNDSSYRDGYNAGGRFGFKSSPLRYEGELSYIHADLKRFNINNVPQLGVDGETAAWFALANIYYDFPDMVPCVAPFIGVGIGYSHVQSSLYSEGPFGVTAFKKSDDGFAYQGTFGFTYNFRENWSANLAYRYMATERLDLIGKIFQAHVASVGVTYRFNAFVYQ